MIKQQGYSTIPIYGKSHPKEISKPCQRIQTQDGKQTLNNLSVSDIGRLPLIDTLSDTLNKSSKLSGKNLDMGCANSVLAKGETIRQPSVSAIGRQQKSFPVSKQKIVNSTIQTKTSVSRRNCQKGEQKCSGIRAQVKKQHSNSVSLDFSGLPLIDIQNASQYENQLTSQQISARITTRLPQRSRAKMRRQNKWDFRKCPEYLHTG